MSILRFKQAISDPKSHQSICISNCGFELNVVKQKTKEEAKDLQQVHHLVLTNMTFNSGVHCWEIICPISCQDIFVGVYNPVSHKEKMETFYTTTPRSIFVCLDLNHN